MKFEYLSYCLKVKELDDEEITYCSAEEPLYRIETGNYEYRYQSKIKSLTLSTDSLLNGNRFYLNTIIHS